MPPSDSATPPVVLIQEEIDEWCPARGFEQATAHQLPMNKWDFSYEKRKVGVSFIFEENYEKPATSGILAMNHGDLADFIGD